MSSRYGQFSTKEKRKRSKNDGRAPDTNKTLGLSPKKKKKKKTKSDDEDIVGSEEEDSAADGTGLLPLFPGPKWCIQKYDIVNTCPLDSFLVLLYAPYLGKLILSPYPELDVGESLLSRTFALLKLNDDAVGARLLWIRELLNKEPGREALNLWSTLEVYLDPKSKKRANHPIQDMVEIIWTQKYQCQREGGCRGRIGSPYICGEAEDSDNNEEYNAQTRTTASRSREQLRSRFRLYTDATMFLDEYLDSMFEDHIVTGCKVRWQEKSSEQFKGCEGPTEFSRAQILKWPHTMVLNVVNGICVNYHTSSSGGARS